jgi:XTP/dITP diphosphohydrolase
MPNVLIATSNAGKLRDFAGAAGPLGVMIQGIPGFHLLPEVVEDGLTFEANARKKAVEYSLHVPGKVVLADDSGLEVDALNGAPGVHSARYAPRGSLRRDGRPRPSGKPDARNSPDAANNARLLRELAEIEMAGVAPAQRTGRFVCWLAAARDGEVVAVFSGKVEGIILDAPRGEHGFGYDPLFFYPPLQRTLAELTPEEKALVSHRGAAFRKFLEWHKSGARQVPRQAR